MYFFQLVRWRTLLFLSFVLVMVQTTIVTPLLMTFGMEAVLSVFEIVLLVVSIVFLMAGGHVINDYFDVKIDRINKPDALIVGRFIDRKRAILIHQLLTAVGVLSGVVLAVLLRSVTLGMIFVLIPGLLWFYSASYKRQFFLGNVIVAALGAFCVFLVAMANVMKLELAYGDLLFETPVARTIYTWVGGFAVFAFMGCLVHEMLKDIVDEEGDREMECYTLPTVLGVQRTKWVIEGILLLVIGVLAYVTFAVLPFEGNLSQRYLMWGVMVPSAAFGLMLYVGKTKSDYARLVRFSKYVMLLTVLYGVVFYYLMAQAYNFPFLGLFEVI